MAEPWYTGPQGDRRRYRVEDLRPLPGGRDFVVRAERSTASTDAVGYAGPVSLKLIADGSDDRAEKLRRRYAALAAAPHPNLVRPLEVFRGPGLFRDEPPPDDECDGLYAASAWVDGSSLRSAAPLPPSQAISLVVDVAIAVQHLHDECGLVHRDLHPGNVIVGGDGCATVIDVGAAVPEDHRDTTTVAGMVGFIAPERTHGVADRGSDRWGVAMLLVHALLGHPQGRATAAELDVELRSVLADLPAAREVSLWILSMLDPDPARRPPDLVRWAREIARLANERPRRRRTRRALRITAGTTALATVAVAATSLVMEAPVAKLRSAVTPNAGASSAVDECAIPFGWSQDESVAAVTTTAAGMLVTAADGGCPTGEAAMFVDAVVQPVAGAGPDGWVVASPTGTAVRLSTAEWASYREIAGRARPENAAMFGGYPVSITPGIDDGSVVIDLSANGVIVGRRRDSQSFWIPDQGVDEWRSHPELGYPMSNPYPATGGVQQDYEHGYLFASADTVAGTIAADLPVEVRMVPDRAAPLTEAGDLTRRILRQPTGTAWFVDAEGRRRWIEDGATWECLGGDAALAADNVPGWAIATLPQGPPASCA